VTVTFNLAAAHPDHRKLIERIITNLVDRYPWVPLRAVRIYEPRSADDHSMGNADTPGTIALNAHWFAQPPSLLQAEALACRKVMINGREISWHPMIEEPTHVLTHEYGHVVTDALPDWREWAVGGWRSALTNPDNAVSGYALADPAEFFAEEFAAAELNFTDPKPMNQLFRSHT
jgi:hypothetical protein